MLLSNRLDKAINFLLHYKLFMIGLFLQIGALLNDL
jgi:hypothetical protein